jgi:hypothetical protein
MPVCRQILQSVTLHKLEGISRLMGNIHPDNLKTGQMVAHASPPAATK